MRVAAIRIEAHNSMIEARMSIWDHANSLQFANEADVEARLVAPLLTALGYADEDIASKFPVHIRVGTRGRHPEADFAVFIGTSRDQNSSLLVVEAKHPSESLQDGKGQAESYAVWLRAPAYVLTNGIQLEIWQYQLAWESTLLLRTKVSDLSANRGRIESILMKPALTRYCGVLRIKDLPLGRIDFSSYETLELERVRYSEQAANRTLRSGDSRDKTIPASALLDSSRGGIIFAASGYGKTTLASNLRRLALFQRAAGASGAARRLPVDVSLPELDALNVDLKRFVRDRLSPHSIGLSDASFTDILRDEGLCITCDGFERLSLERRARSLTDIRNVCRDYPRIQLFVFSRPKISLDLPLPTYELLELSDEEEREVAENFGKCQKLDTRFFVATLPPFLRRLAPHPLLLSLMLRYWGKQRHLPQHLPDLFATWLSRIVDEEKAPSSVVSRRERALFKIAALTIEKPVDRLVAFEELSKIGIDGTVVDDLIDCGGLNTAGAQIELIHESLADYLRALEKVRSLDQERSHAIDNAQLRTDSLFAVLLMSLLRDRESQIRLWSRYSALPLHDYLYAIRFSGDVSEEFRTGGIENAQSLYADDLAKGADALISVYFPQLRRQISRELTHLDADIARAECLFSNDLSNVAYGYFPAVRAHATDKDHRLTRFRNLKLSKNRIDSGRLVATTDVAKAFNDIVRNRSFAGGPVWTNESLVSEIRAIEEGGTPLPILAPLTELKRIFEPHSGTGHRDSPFSRRVILIDDILEKIDLLLKGGAERLDLWWEAAARRRDIDDTTLARLLDEHFRRSQRAYCEVVERNFTDVSSQLRHYPMLPVRWLLTVVPPTQHSLGRTMHFYFEPVQNWSSAGADVTFSNSPPTIDSNDLWLRNEERLRVFGRRVGTGYGLNGWGQLPSFDGHITFRGNSGETSVVGAVCDMIREDLNFLFEPMRAVEGFLISTLP